MCGIVFVLRQDKKPAQKMTMKRYREQKSRGQQGFGFISIGKDGKFHEWGRAKDEADIQKLIEKDNSPVMLFHHRFPTSTPNFIEATHPIKVSNKRLDFDYYVVHNGIISNDNDLKKEHELEGFEYDTKIVESFKTKENTYKRELWNDSEAFAIELAKVIDGKQEKIEAKGSIAFIALQVNKYNKQVINVFYGRNWSNPLRKLEGSDFFTLTSEGKGDPIAANVLFAYEIRTGETYSKALDIGASPASYDQGRYDRSWIKHGKSVRSTFGFRTAQEEETDEVPPPRRIGAPRDPTTGTSEVPLPIPLSELADEEDEFNPEAEDTELLALQSERDALEDEIEYYKENGNGVEGMDDLIKGLQRQLIDINTDIWVLEETLDKTKVNDLQAS